MYNEFNCYENEYCECMILYLNYFVSQIEQICIKNNNLNTFDQLLSIFQIFANFASLLPIEYVFHCFISTRFTCEKNKLIKQKNAKTNKNKKN